jgi:hypothetical protein
VPDQTHAMTNGSVAGFSATLSTLGLSPGGHGDRGHNAHGEGVAEVLRSGR